MSGAVETIPLVSVSTRDVQDVLNKLTNEKRKLQMEFKLITDDIVRGSNAATLKTEYEKIANRIRDIEKEMEEISRRSTFKHYIVDHRGVYPPLPQSPKEEPPKKQVKRRPRKPLSPKEKEQLLEANRIALSAAFKFKTIEECQSSKRSKPYYMSKDDLIATIEKELELKKRMPQRYKSKKKEEICNDIFAVIQKN